MQIILGAMLAGLLATPHCAGMCGGFATACARPRSGLFAWHLGRITTYALVGVAGGAAGHLMPGPAWVPGVVATLLLVWFAAGLAGLVRPIAPRLPVLSRVTSRVAGGRNGASRYAFGVLTGMLPCGMVYAAASMAVASGSALVGGAVMIAFGAATVPGLTLLSMSLQRVAARSIWSRRALALLVLGLGLWSVGVRAGGFGGHAMHSTNGEPVAAPGVNVEASPAAGADGVHVTESPSAPAPGSHGALPPQH